MTGLDKVEAALKYLLRLARASGSHGDIAKLQNACAFYVEQDSAIFDDESVSLSDVIDDVSKYRSTK